MPKTTFDVDLVKPASGDTYESICQEYYNDKQFATALKAFNKNMPLDNGRLVEVPPRHILRRKFPTETGSIPRRGSGSGSSSTPNWGPAGGASEPTRVTGNNRGTFVVPQGGMTLEAVAKQVGVPWRDLYDLNQQHFPGTPLPAGTELKLPVQR